MIKINYKKSIKKLSLLAIIASSLFLTACSSSIENNQTVIKQAKISSSKKVVKKESKNIITVKKTNNPHNKKTKIMNEYAQWQGTKYRLGGTTKNGIDCSAFVGKVFDGAFALDLPRTTTELKFLGTPVDKNDLQVGDLVFFRKNKHVGVYIGDDQFVHSSSKKGVITSSLSSGYYNEKYTQARRLM